MKPYSVVGVIACALYAIAASAMAACDPSDSTFVCGASNAEDLVRLTGTPWVVASHLNSFPPNEVDLGPLEAISIDTHEVRRLYPTPEATVDWDNKTYPECRTPPENLASIGLNVRPLSRNKFRLYVANIGGRKSIEIIDVTVRTRRLMTAWRGCIHAPAGIGPNSVVPLPDGGVALSGGGVAIWRPGGGWKEVEGTKGSNGVEVSRDGQWLFVAIIMERSVIRVPVGGGAAQTVFKGDFFTDNLRRGEDGRLYVAGPISPGGIQPLLECLKGAICDVGFAVAQIDPDTLASTEIFRNDGIKGAFGAATTALQIGNDLWIGTVRGDRVAIFNVKP